MRKGFIRRKKIGGGSGSHSDGSGILAAGVVSLGGGIVEGDKVREMKDDNIDVMNGGWITYMSKGNGFLDGALSLLENSGTLSAVIKQQVSLIVGGGFVLVDGRSGVLQSGDGEDKSDIDVESLNDFLSNVNDDEDDLIDVLKNVVNDFLSLGNGFIEMIRGSDEAGRFFYVNHWDCSLCQIKKEDKGKKGEVEGVRMVGINEDWRKDPNGKRATVVPLYPKWKEMEDGTERSVIQVKEYMRGFKYWGVPAWLAVKKWVELEYRVGMENGTKFENGYMPSAIIQFFGAKSKKEARELVDDAVDKFTGTGNNSKILFQALSDEKYKANVQLLEDRNDGSFMELTSLAVQRIITGMGWGMGLAGVETSGKLGGNQQLEKEYERVNNVVVNPVRELFLKKVVDVILKEAGIWLEKEKEWDGIVLGFGNNSVYSLTDMIEVDDVLLVNEKRNILGYDKLDDDEVRELDNNKNVKRNGNNNPNIDTGARVE